MLYTKFILYIYVVVVGVYTSLLSIYRGNFQKQQKKTVAVSFILHFSFNKMQQKTTPNVCGQLKNDFQLNNSLKIINLNKQQQQQKPMTKKQQP